MLIRSQNEKNIINMDYIDTICCLRPRETNTKIADYEEIRAYNGEEPSILGRYSTEQKAIKVLDAICRFHSAMVSWKHGTLSMADVQIVMGEYARFTDFDFFQMPADEELESEEGQ